MTWPINMERKSMPSTQKYIDKNSKKKTKKTWQYTLNSHAF